MLTSQELPAFFSETTFTEQGKEFIENLLAALILDREALLATEQPGVKITRQKLITSLPVLMKNTSLPEGSLKRNINDAVILQQIIKTSGSEFSDFIRQQNLFETKYDRKTVYLNRLIDSGKLKFKQAIEGYNDAIMKNQGASLFGEKPTIEQIFDHWIKGNVSDMDQRLIEASEVVVKNEVFGTFAGQVEPELMRKKFKENVPIKEVFEKAGVEYPEPKLRKILLREQEGLKIYLVDGEAVRRDHIEFVSGGHGYVYDYIPKDEVWIDDNQKDKPNDMEATIRHELFEIKKMRDEGLSYENAHELANAMEKEIRQESSVDKKTYTLTELREIYSFENGFNLSDLDLDNIVSGTHTRYVSIGKLRGTYPNYERDPKYKGHIIDSDYKWFMEVSEGQYKETTNPYTHGISDDNAQYAGLTKKEFIVLDVTAWYKAFARREHLRKNGVSETEYEEIRKQLYGKGLFLANGGITDAGRRLQKQIIADFKKAMEGSTERYDTMFSSDYVGYQMIFEKLWGGKLAVNEKLDLSEEIKIAENIGREVFQAGGLRVPAKSHRVMNLLKGLKVGESGPILAAFLKGWDDESKKKQNLIIEAEKRGIVGNSGDIIKGFDDYTTNLEIVRPFISKGQLDYLVHLYHGEEKQGAVDILTHIGNIIKDMPKTYETDKVEANNKIIYLHYFIGGSDWYIVEKDKNKDQSQMFGYAILNGDHEMAEWGYVSALELKENNVELDFYWTPKKFSEVKGKVENSEAGERTDEEERKIFGYSFMFDPANEEGLKLINTLQGFNMVIGLVDYPNGISIEYRTEKYELIDNSGEFKLSRVGKEGYPDVIDFKDDKGKLKSVFNLAKEIEDAIINDQKKEGKESRSDKRYTLRELKEMYTYEKGYNLSDLDLDNIKTGTHTRYESVSKIRGVYPDYERDKYGTPVMYEYKWYVEIEPGIFTETENPYHTETGIQKGYPFKKGDLVVIKEQYRDKGDNFTYKILEVSDIRAEIVPIDSKLNIPPINVVNIYEIEKKTNKLNDLLNKPENIVLSELSKYSKEELDNLISQLEGGMRDVLHVEQDTERAIKLKELIGRVIDARNIDNPEYNRLFNKSKGSSSPVALPTIDYNGETYFIDWRLQEIRNKKTAVSTPFTKITSDELKAAIRFLRSGKGLNIYMAGLDDGDKMTIEEEKQEAEKISGEIVNLGKETKKAKILIDTYNQKFDFLSIKNRRFVYCNKTGELVFGGNDIDYSSHSQEHYDLGVKSHIDNCARGWIGTGKDYPDGIIHFAPAYTSDIIKESKLFDEAFDTLSMFQKNGANQNTIVRGFGSLKQEQPISAIMPDYDFPGNKEKPKPESSSLVFSDYKNPFELNKAIEALLERKWNDKPESWSADELQFISGYSGYGGLDEYGEISKGSLFEFYTPEKVIEKMWGLAYKYGYKDGRLCEPSAGTGLFLKREYVKSSVIKDAYEINKYSAKVVRLLYPEVNVNDGAETKYFEQLFIKSNYTVRDKISPVHELVIGNPPYGEAAGLYMGMGEKTYSHAKNYIDYFIFRGLDLLLPGGLLVYIIGAEVAGGGTPWLNQGSSKCKEMISKKGKLIDAYRLPEGVFARTNVVSDIIVFRKK